MIFTDGGACVKKMLITGGTGFVSRYAAEYFASSYDVYVLNRNTKPQSKGVTLIQADRHALGNTLKKHHFDVVLDAVGFDKEDIEDLLDGLGSFNQYIFISSSAVYPETETIPFAETARMGVNKYWGNYGTKKIAAEEYLIQRVPEAYILRPPYLYGPMNNVYRESFVFECALQDRVFCLPGDGSMKLQFLHIEDLFRIIEKILETKPSQQIYNVGNESCITVRDWVKLCYEAVGKHPKFRSISKSVEQRNYFPFYNYEYALDVGRQRLLISNMKPMREGLKEAFEWYLKHSDSVNKKPLMQFIDEYL